MLKRILRQATIATTFALIASNSWATPTVPSLGEARQPTPARGVQATIPSAGQIRPAARVPAFGATAATLRPGPGATFALLAHPPRADGDLATPLTPTPAPVAIAPTNPAVLEKHGTATYATLGRHMFHAGVKVTDVDQGAIGDCYFAAAAAAIAHKNPEIIKNAFTFNPDGTVTVKLFMPDAGGVYKPTLVQIDRQVPVTGGSALYLKGHNTHHVEQWPGLLEKAFAKAKGSYGAVEGGWSSQAMSMLTGKPSQMVQINPQQTDQLFGALKQAVAEGKPMAASTFSDAELPGMMSRLAQAEPQSPTVATMQKLHPEGFAYAGSGVWGNHAYTVLGVSEQNGQKMVIVRNPWGKSEPPPGGFGTGAMNNRGDGIFALPVETFGALFRRVDIGG